jgi:hypothetical protein
VALRFDDGLENRRLAISTRVIGRLAALYIERDLDLKELVYLARRRGRGFPKYVDQESYRREFYMSAYPGRRPNFDKPGRPTGTGRMIVPRFRRTH